MEHASAGTLFRERVQQGTHVTAGRSFFAASTASFAAAMSACLTLTTTDFS